MFRPFSAPHRGQRNAVAAGAATGASTGEVAPTWPPIGAPQAWQNAFCGGLSR
jgi:hypothetical protein